MAMAAMGSFPTFNFRLSQATFTAAMAKRNSAGPFAAGVLAQGDRAGSTTAMDTASVPLGTAIANKFYPTVDLNQFSISFWITPEWAGSEAVDRFIWGEVNSLYLYRTSGGLLSIRQTGVDLATVSVAGWTAGTTYHVVLSLSAANPIDGTNYVRWSINDVHTFGRTSAITTSSSGNILFGQGGVRSSANALIEGLTIYRRCLWDGTYGVNVGNGDEINLIYAAGAGADPCTITGSWDVCLCVPTNSTVGALTTGTGDAWSHPHGSNLVTDGWLQSYYGGEPWAVKFNGTSTKIDCGSGATLDDLPAGGATMQVEAWFRSDAVHIGAIVSKGYRSGNIGGWCLNVHTGNHYVFTVCCATSAAFSQGVVSPSILGDGKWHHILGHYNDTTKAIQVAIDGVWQAAGTAGVGAYKTDVTYNLKIGDDTAGSNYFNGAIGWINLYNNAFYTPGTNFKPPRTPTAPDVEEWLLNEGTGVTCTAQVTAPANNGTITAGTWQPQWYPEGTPIVPTSVQGSANYVATITAAATINDLHDGAFTAEGWFRIPKIANLQTLFLKGSLGVTGWSLYVNVSGTLFARVMCATTSASCNSSSGVADNRWHYIKITWDDADDRKVRIYIDNVLDATSGAGVGAVITDVASNGGIGTGGYPFTGGHGWIRWSNVVRGAGMISRSTPPDETDANTMGQWEADEGAGAVLTDLSGEGNNGAMAGTYSWVNTGAMDVDSPGARVYGWGDCMGSDAVSEGIKQTFTGLTAGSDRVVRVSGYSEDGVGIPRVVIYDETNAAQITAMTGTATSTEWTPNVFIFSFELPTNARGAAADCTSYSIKLISTTAGNVGWHQAEIYTNLLDNPSLDVGAVADPWIPYGWTNVGLDAGDSEIETVIRHSEGASIQANAGASNEYPYCDVIQAIGKFICQGAWLYNSSAQAKTIIGSSVGNWTKQYTLLGANYSEPLVGVSWLHSVSVFRTLQSTTRQYIIFDTGGANERYVDDYYAILLDDVTLTVTPASATNSLEGTGIRVDGRDKDPQTISGIALGKGKIKFNVTPRHSAATVALFGNATPIVAYVYGDANNYITLDWSAANTLRLRYNASGGGVQTGTWDATGAIVAGTIYAMEIKYTGAAMTFSVDNVLRITITAASIFSTALATFYPGSDATPANQFDAVYS
jgi:hypothetical protein